MGTGAADASDNRIIYNEWLPFHSGSTHSEKTDKMIAAIATAPGGAIGIVRASGKGIVELTERLLLTKDLLPHPALKAGRVSFGIFHDPEKGENVDEVLVSTFRAPHSYTGEDSVEISCHASPYILQRVLSTMIKAGCRLAKPGEFTETAYLNHRMDLSQAEAVADLIASQTEAQHRIAMQQMRGGLSAELKALREKLLHVASLLELELDFSDHEDLEFADRSELQQLMDEVTHKVEKLAKSFAAGNAIKEGVPVAIVGPTNAGKSTLLNGLVGEERAIVSDIHGTTRDFIEDSTVIGGINFRFIDTAGLRSTDDPIESIGIERSYGKARDASVVVLMLDISEAISRFQEIAPTLLPIISKDKHFIVLLNKADLIGNKKEASEIEKTFPVKGEFFSVKEKTISVKGETGTGAGKTAPIPEKTAPDAGKPGTVIEKIKSIAENSGSTIDEIRFVSAQSPSDIIEIKRLLRSLIPTADTGVTIANARHHGALLLALDDISRARQSLSAGLSADLISEDLRACTSHLAEICGEITSDQTLQNIFKHFCVGK